MLIILCFSVVLGWAGLQQMKPSETCLFRPGVACLLLCHGICSCCRGNNRSWCLGVWCPVIGLPSEPAQCEAGLWLGCYLHALMFLHPVEQEGKMPHCYCPCTTTAWEVCHSFSPCWAARLQPWLLGRLWCEGNVFQCLGYSLCS